jgi:hypothetical protein
MSLVAKEKLIKIIFITTLFLISRFFILQNPPPYYSDVKQDYERYANMWWYGLTPYRQHYYEYPPATIPLLVFPLLFDQLGIGKFYPNYRIGIFLFDAFLFMFILKALSKLKVSILSKTISILFLCLAPVIAKDFFYEGIDLFFSGTLTIALISILLYKQNSLRTRIFTYAAYWWSFGLKFMSLPLFPLIFITKKLNLKKEIIALILGFLLIWIVPLSFYRSSLSVSYVFHKDRPLKYSSFGSYLIEGINFFTQSEERVNQPPDFQMKGPISTKMNSYFSLIFPFSVVLVILISLSMLLKNIPLKKWFDYLFSCLFENKNLPLSQSPYNFLIKSSLIYILTLFLTGKVISQPFPIWLIPLVAIFPFESLIQQISFLSLVLILLIQMTSPLIKLDTAAIILNPFTVGYLLDTLRFLVIILLLFYSIKMSLKTS